MVEKIVGHVRFDSTENADRYMERDGSMPCTELRRTFRFGHPETDVEIECEPVDGGGARPMYYWTASRIARETPGYVGRLEEDPGRSVQILTYTRFGSCGPQNSYRGKSGSKVHVLEVREVVGVVGEGPFPPRSYAGAFLSRDQFSAADRAFYGRDPEPRKIYFGISGRCNRNGSFTGVIREGLTAADVTCKSCQRG